MVGSLAIRLSSFPFFLNSPLFFHTHAFQIAKYGFFKKFSIWVTLKIQIILIYFLKKLILNKSLRFVCARVPNTALIVSAQLV